MIAGNDPLVRIRDFVDYYLVTEGVPTRETVPEPDDLTEDEEEGRVVELSRDLAGKTIPMVERLLERCLLREEAAFLSAYIGQRLWRKGR